MTANIIDDKFNAWTNGLDAKAARIAVFSHIRDIPYAIVPALRDPVLGPPGMLRKNCGSCTPKHYLLAQMFQKLNIPVKFATYPFFWDDPLMPYPEVLRKLAARLPKEYHLACKAYLHNRWVLVDATWESARRMSLK